MPYTFDISGRLRSLAQPYPRNNTALRVTSSGGIKDNLRLSQFYVESDHEIEVGHPVQWSGNANNIDSRGNRVDHFYDNFLLSDVVPADTYSNIIAGIVLEKAAGPGDTLYTHKGIHSTHPLPNDVKNIYRVANDIALAWVLEDSMGELEGIYKRYVNGVEDTTGPYQLTFVSNDTFVFNRTMEANMELAVSQIKARLDALTLKTE